MAGTVTWIGDGKIQDFEGVPSDYVGQTGAENPDNFIEQSQSIGWGPVDNNVADYCGAIYTTPASYDFNANTSQHIFCWLNVVGTVADISSGGIGIFLGIENGGGGANDAEASWYVGPRDGYTGGWVPYVISPSKDFSNVIQAGSQTWTTTGNPGQLTAVEALGGYHLVVPNLQGNIDNAWFDVFSTGEGYKITDGDIGSPAVFADIESFEESNRFGGLVSQSGIIFPQSKIVIGDDGVSNTYFNDSGFTVVFLDSEVYSASVGNTTPAVETDFYELKVQEATGNTQVILSNGTIGCSGIEQNLSVDFSGVTSVNLSNLAIDNAQGGIILDGNVTWDLGTIKDCGQVNLNGQPSFLNVAFVDNTDEYALLVSDTSELTNVSDLSFSGHGNGTANSGAIFLDFPANTNTRSITLTNMSFSDRGTSNADIVIAETVGTGLVEINVSGTALEEANVLDLRATDNFTIVSGLRTLTLTGIIAGSEVRIFESGTTTELTSEGTGSIPVESSAGGSEDYQYTFSPGTDVDIVIHATGYIYERISGFTLTDSDNSLPIQQRVDRIYI